MARAGRKSKPGKRYPSGKRIIAPALVKPSEWVAEQVKRYGQHYCWPMGRAYAAGLIGAGDEAKSRLQAAQKFVRLYRLFFGGDAYTCPLDDSPRGTNTVLLTVSDNQERNREWLRQAMRDMDIVGVRPYFDQLITRQHIDTGPEWLDRLLAKRDDLRDRIILEAATKALDIITPRQVVHTIRAESY